MSPKLLFVYSRGWKKRLRDVTEGASPAEAYGYFALGHRGVDVDAVDETIASSHAWRIASLAFQRGYAIPRSGLGYRIHQARAVRVHLRDDPERWIVATTDSIALPLLALKYRGLLRNRVIYMSIGLCDRVLRGIVHPTIARRYGRLMQFADAVLAYSPREAEFIREWTGHPNVWVMPFGVDATWWSQREANSVPSTLVSVGRDPSRDFVTLARAVERLPVATTIISPIARSQGVSETESLRICETNALVDVRAAFWRSQLVVVPIKRVDQPSGQSTVLQAMAAGKPVITTDTGWASHAGLREGEHFVGVPAEDAFALRSAIERVLRLPLGGAQLGRQACAFVRTHLTPSDQADVILQAIAGARQ